MNGAYLKRENPNSENMPDDDDEDEQFEIVAKKQKFDSRNCPYLDTINRIFLDFDFEKLCSVTLSPLNVYACLVCGIYYQGRGNSTPAYVHSGELDHHVFMNLHTLKFFCIPDNYEIIDSSLDDIKHVCNPIYTKEQIEKLGAVERVCRPITGTPYRPGIVGLNNIKANDYCNVVLQIVSHIPPIRDFFLQDQNYKSISRPPGDILKILLQRLGELYRKLWNFGNFKAHVSPHEMLQAVVLCSKKVFQITKQGDAIDVLSWLLNSLHIALNGTKKLKSSIISRTLRGKMKVSSRRLIPAEVTDPEELTKFYNNPDYLEKFEEQPFTYLTLDVPPMPLFKDEQEQNVIPQIALTTLLHKFDGVQEKEYKTYKDSTVKKFTITTLPDFLLIYIKRFYKNNFFIEKNKTLVNFAIKGLDMSVFLTEEAKKKYKPENCLYDLVSNVVHEDEITTESSQKLVSNSKGHYKVHVIDRPSQKWFELQDLHVTEILPQMITLSQAYIQVYERRKN